MDMTRQPNLLEIRRFLIIIFIHRMLCRQVIPENGFLFILPVFAWIVVYIWR